MAAAKARSNRLKSGIDRRKMYEGPHALSRPWDFSVRDLGNGRWLYQQGGIEEIFCSDQLLLAVAQLTRYSSGEMGDYGPNSQYGVWPTALLLIADLLIGNRRRIDGDPVLDFGTDEANALMDRMETVDSIRRHREAELAEAAAWRKSQTKQARKRKPRKA